MNAKKAKLLRSYCKKYKLPFRSAKKEYKNMDGLERIKLLEAMKNNLAKQLDKTKTKLSNSS